MFKLSPRLVVMVVMLGFFGFISAMVPPHPKRGIPAQFRPKAAERQLPAKADPGKQQLPNHMLVLRVQFSDLSMKTTAVYPDLIPHDESFFERWMVHLKDFYNDASHAATSSWHLYPEVLTLPRTIAYYGADTEEYTDANLEQMLADLVLMKDAEIDFSLYGGVIIFHAGAGQETDIGLKAIISSRCVPAPSGQPSSPARICRDITIWKMTVIPAIPPMTAPS